MHCVKECGSCERGCGGRRVRWKRGRQRASCKPGERIDFFISVSNEDINEKRRRFSFHGGAAVCRKIPNGRTGRYPLLWISAACDTAGESLGQGAVLYKAPHSSYISRADKMLVRVGPTYSRDLWAMCGGSIQSLRLKRGQQNCRLSCAQ
jgi:hypothetical protein